MGMFGTKAPMLDRDTALGGFPVRLPVARREEESGKLYITVEFRRPGWQQMLGASTICERTFGLDPYGREVYEACDGKTNVQNMVNRFARNHSITIAEAEVAIASFLQTLMQRGMVGMKMRKKQRQPADT